MTFSGSCRSRAPPSPAAQRQQPRSSRRQPQGALPTTAVAAVTGASTDPPRRHTADRSVTTCRTASRSRTICFFACGRPSHAGVDQRGWSLRQQHGYGDRCVDRGGRHCDRLSQLLRTIQQPARLNHTTAEFTRNGNNKIITAPLSRPIWCYFSVLHDASHHAGGVTFALWQSGVQKVKVAHQLHSAALNEIGRVVGRWQRAA